MPDRNISVLLVDDHHLVRRGFRRMLEDEDDIVVVGEASDGQEAIDKARELAPGVIVMDFALPEMNGAAAARQILKTAPRTGILILSMHSEPSYVRTCLDAGVRGYLLKNAIDLELIDAVRKVAAGQQVLDPRLEAVSQPDSAAPELTPRELQVLQLIVNGKSNREIAGILGVSANTIAVHRTNLMQALGIHNTADLVVYAIRNGLASIT
ncbi:MAG: response regulator transcription factor [Bryobacteraceae bacterium]|jgi:DNA-binding NarL/FixJ family response regulator